MSDELQEAIHELDKRVTLAERKLCSVAQDVRNAAAHSVEVEKKWLEISDYLNTRREFRADFRKIVVHALCWLVPSILGLTLLVFSSGLRGFLRAWLAN